MAASTADSKPGRVRMRRRDRISAWLAQKDPELRATAKELERSDAFQRRLTVAGTPQLTDKLAQQLREQACACACMQPRMTSP